MTDRYKPYWHGSSTISASKLIWDDGDLRIQGFDRAGSVVVEFQFGGDAIFVRISDEGMRLRLQRDLRSSKVVVILDRESELIAWLREECLRTRDLEKAKHYIFFIGEEAFDVVSISEPDVIGMPSNPAE